MPAIKLFVCCHQHVLIPEHPLLVPIQVGAALADTHFPGFLHDDAGENISHKNRSYCELTAQYWAWKNADVGYYGFFHYRRYLYPDERAKCPYRIENKPSAGLLDRLGYDRFAEMIGKHDVIAPIGEDMYVPVREHYANAPHHHRKDLELTEHIIRERHPELTAALESYLSGTMQYFGNMYIMRRRVFHDYCTWLFPILEEFERRANLSGYSPQELRVNGYLAERLFGVYYTHCKGSLRTLELPRVHFYPKGEVWRKRAFNALLPPGSGWRATIKRLAAKRTEVYDGRQRDHGQCDRTDL